MKLSTRPAHLASDLSPEERSSAIALLDLESSDVNGKMRIVVSAAFAARRIRCGALGGDCFLACTAADVEVAVTDATFTAWFDGKGIDVEYKQTSSTESGETSHVEPRASVKAADVELAASGGSEGKSKSARHGWEASYALREHVIAAARTGQGVRWQIDMPRSPQLVRDYLYCTVPLHAECRTETQPRCGFVSLQPTVSLFGPNKRPASRKQTLAAYFVAFTHGIRIRGSEDVRVEFEEILP